MKFRPTQHYKVILSDANVEAALFAFQSLQAAYQTAMSVLEDPHTLLEIKQVYLTITGSISHAMRGIEATLPDCSKKVFKREVKDVDPLLFEDLKSSYLKMNKYQKDMLVMAADGILNNELTVQAN